MSIVQMYNIYLNFNNLLLTEKQYSIFFMTWFYSGKYIIVILFYERWQKFKLFWFFVRFCVVEKNQKCLNAQWPVALLLTVWLCVVRVSEALNFQPTTMFILCS